MHHGLFKMNRSQLFALMFMFELGSALVVGLGLDAGNDAWLALLIGMTGGLGVFAIQASLYRAYPEMDLGDIIYRIAGRWLGTALMILYSGYFLYIGARVMRDFGELLVTYVLSETPVEAVNLLMIIVIGWSLSQGIETVGRTAQLAVPIVILLMAVTILSLLLTDVIKPQYLLPVLDKGWQPVLKAAFPVIITFPFGEMIAFSMIASSLNKPHNILQTGWSAMLTAGVMILMATLLYVMVLGAERASLERFPMILLIGKINIGDIFQRIDIIAIIALVLGGFFKIAVFMYAGVRGIAGLMRIKVPGRPYSILLVTAGGLIFAASLGMSSNITEHLQVGLEKVPRLLHLPLQAGIPAVLLVVTLVRRKLVRH